MDPSAALVALTGLVALSGAAALLLRSRAGRPRATAGRVVTADELGGGAFGSTATLVQFSTRWCGTCPGTARLLREIAAERPGVEHLEVDLGRRPDVADRFAVLQTPTVLLLDGERRLRARIGGAPDRPALLDRLDALGGIRAR